MHPLGFWRFLKLWYTQPDQVCIPPKALAWVRFVSNVLTYITIVGILRYHDIRLNTVSFWPVIALTLLSVGGLGHLALYGIYRRTSRRR